MQQMVSSQQTRLSVWSAIALLYCFQCRLRLQEGEAREAREAGEDHKEDKEELREMLAISFLYTF